MVFPYGAFAADSGHFGKAIKVEGEVQVTRRFKKKVIKADDPLLVKDRVSTGKDSSLEIQMGDKNNLFITANSKITLHHPTSDGKKKEVMIKLMAGSIRSKLDGLKDTDTVFSIRSPTAVAGVRGTDFVTAYNPALGSKAFALTVLEGSVEVAGIDAATQKATAGIQVKPAQRITVSDTGAVQDVVKVTPEEMNQLKQQFSVSTDEVKEEKKDDSQEEKKDKKDKEEDEDKKDKEEKAEDEDQEKEEKKEGDKESDNKEQDSEQGEQKQDDSKEESKAESDSNKDSDTKEDTGEKGDSDAQGDKSETDSGDSKQEDSSAESGKTDEGRSESSEEQTNDSSGDSRTAQDSAGTAEGSETSPAGGEQESTAPTSDGSSVSNDTSSSSAVDNQGAEAPSLEVDTVGGSEVSDSSEVRTDVDVKVETQDLTVEVEADIELDLDQVDSAVDQTTEIVDDVVDDQIQDQIDAINEEVGRTLRLIIRQED